jgi:GNAT superfamily N-acetyltransferase
MEGSIERAPNVELQEIPLSDEQTLKEIGELITKYSWFEGYPVEPLDELRQADYIVGAYAGKTLAGFGAISRVASPDGKDNGEWWFADAVVVPDFRRYGIYTKLYEARMRWLDGKPGRILTCTEVELIDDFMIAHGWHKIRDTKDEQGGDCRVYEFDRT